MKIKEVLVENQIDEAIPGWNALKQGIAGAKGAVQGTFSSNFNPIQAAKAGMAASAAKSQQQDLVNRVAQKAIVSWNQQKQNIITTGGELNQEQVAQWWNRYTQGKDTVGADNPVPDNLNNDAAMVAWLNKEVANYLAKKDMQAADPAAAGLDQPDQAPAGTEVDTPAQGKVIKRADKKWYNEKGQEIVTPADIAELEKRAKANTAPAPETAPADATTPADDGTITIAGQKLNPKNPQDAALIKKLQSQMQQQQAQAVPAEEVPAEETPAEEEPVELPDISALTPEQRAELRKQLIASIQQGA